MHPIRRKRLLAVVFVVVGAGAAIGLLLLGLGENVNMFYPPAEVVSGNAPVDRNIRAGGMVLEGSWQRGEESLYNEFVLTDRAGAEFTVEYDGIVPDLFREGQGVIVEGRLDRNRRFTAERVLAKHDENYMPPELIDMHEGTGG